jgi:glycosyltransferase involved in cell wall biosynthesis
MLTSAPFPPREGIGFYVWNLSRWLQRAGHSVHIITRGRPRGTSCEIMEGIPVWRAGFTPVYPFHVHLHSVIVGRLLRRIAAQIDLLHAHTPLVRLPQTDIPLLVTVHSLIRADTRALRLDSPLTVLMKLQAPMSCALEGELLRRAWRVAAVSSGVAAELGIFEHETRRVRILGNGVDADFYKPAPDERQPGRPYILAVGRLEPGKGWKELIGTANLVARQRPGCRFVIAGGGSLEGSLQRLIQERRLASQVVLLGHVPGRSDLAGLYQGAAVFVHPSLHEGLPTVLLEAMACGCPAVATAVGGALDVIEPGRNGFLVPPGDPERMARAILNCLDDPGLCSRVGAAARETIEARYTWPIVSRNYLDEYEHLLEEHRN